MSETAKLREALQTTTVTLRTLRKAVAAAGLIDVMHDIDTLLHVTQVEAERKLTNIEIAARQVRPPSG